MSSSRGKRRYRRPPKHGKHLKRRRGVHKHAGSPETRRWENDHLIPERPPWLPVETYVKLAELRASL